MTSQANHLCKWNWCSLTFPTSSLLLSHLIHDHVRKEKTHKASELNIYRERGRDGRLYGREKGMETLLAGTQTFQPGPLHESLPSVGNPSQPTLDSLSPFFHPTNPSQPSPSHFQQQNPPQTAENAPQTGRSMTSSSSFQDDPLSQAWAMMMNVDAEGVPVDATSNIGQAGVASEIGEALENSQDIAPSGGSGSASASTSNSNSLPASHLHETIFPLRSGQQAIAQPQTLPPAPQTPAQTSHALSDLTTTFKSTPLAQNQNQIQGQNHTTPIMAVPFPIAFGSALPSPVRPTPTGTSIAGNGRERENTFDGVMNGLIPAIGTAAAVGKEEGIGNEQSGMGGDGGTRQGGTGLRFGFGGGQTPTKEK